MLCHAKIRLMPFIFGELFAGPPAGLVIANICYKTLSELSAVLIISLQYASISHISSLIGISPNRYLRALSFKNYPTQQRWLQHLA
jgi:hypothetical protein